jgi:Na+/H+ antiporter NhaC
MENPTWLSLLPPFIAIATALLTKQVFVSLFAGIWLGWIILDGGNPIAGLHDALESMVAVFADRGNTLILIFSALIGSFIALTQRSGGVEGFVNWVVGRGYVRTSRGAQLLPSFIGVALFLESNLTCLISGAVARPLFDRFRLSREKLAYLCDSTAAPVCVMFPFNAWGALILGILAGQDVERPLSVMVAAIPFNFYALLAIAFVFYIAASGKDWGPMARAETRARETGKVLRDGAQPLVSDEVLSLPTKEGTKPRARNMVVPTLVLLAMVVLGLYITGEGDILAGDGSTAIFWAMTLGVVVAIGMYLVQGIFSMQEAIDLTMRGIGGLVPVLLLIVLAFALGSTSRDLQAGQYLASLTEGVLSPILLPALLFIMSGVMAFSTGTSWGTFAIMLPIGVPMAEALGINLHLMVGAVLGGSIFGDHCSPISDTTIVASLAAGADHIDHVNTQLPYAVGIALVSALLYVVAAALF